MVDNAKIFRRVTTDKLILQIVGALDENGAPVAARGVDGRLRPDPKRFPSGMKALGDYLHARQLKFGLYTCAGTLSCEGDEAAGGHEKLDMETFADWGVDFVKVDGCHLPGRAVAEQYAKLGNALQNKNIFYACSWPAYLNVPEADKPFEQMFYGAGCNMWRNTFDTHNSFWVLRMIANHWAENTEALERVPKPSAIPSHLWRQAVLVVRMRLPGSAYVSIGCATELKE